MLESLFKKQYNIIKKIDYMINLQYGQKDWQMDSALRELIANSIDTKTPYTYNWSDGVATISDQGCGLPKKAFVMGGSSKSSDTTCIGQFGEGLKMCLVTALRNSKRVSIQTVGYGVECQSVHSDEYDSDLMRIMFTDMSCETGTIIKMECSKEDYDKALEMFLQLKTGYKKLDKSLYLPGGFISILGLTTEERPNLLFSYDLNDKSLTNRDRNVIKSRKFKEEMVKILSSVKKPEAIKLYMKGLTEAPESEEYKVSFVPKSKDIWKETILGIYGEKSVYSSSPDGDVKAVYKGMKVIPSHTKQVREMLKAIGFSSSAQKTKAVKNANVSIRSEEENKIVYPIARSYVEHWDVNQAGRELMANALDMSPDATIRFENGRCVIEDNGAGIERKHFVIGNSGKGDDQIGVFGEGFKMASLVLARENRDMLIETVGYDYRPALEMSKEFSTEIFCFRYEKNSRKKGTVISFKANEKDVDKIRSLFICFDDEVKYLDRTPVIDIIQDDNSAIYVNGLLSTTINSLFSYNIKGDKTIVDSRDRNHVDETRLTQVLKDYYDNTVSTDVIGRILSGWEKDPYLKEYSIVLEPRMPIIWYSAVDEIYPNACIFSTLSEKANFIADSAGYKILRNVPPYIMQVLSHSLKSADEIAADIGDKGILLDNQVIFPITENYISKWDDSDALRELIANAIDASGNKDADISWEDGCFSIEDCGCGLKRENLMLGSSDSRSVGTAIGTFGEGLKLAALRLSKGREFTIESVGFTVKASIRRNNAFNSDVLVMDLSENDRARGTRVFGHCDKKSLEKAKDSFLRYDSTKKEVSTDLYTGGDNGIYVNGSRIYKCKSVGYSYNMPDITAKRYLTRDRNSFENPDYVNTAIIRVLSEVKDTDVIKNIIDHIKDDTVEGMSFLRAGYIMSSHVKKRWRKAAMELYPNCCLSSRYNPENNLVAADSNITVLTNLPKTKEQMLLVIGFPSAEEAVQLKSAKEKRETVIPLNKLTPEERAQWDVLMDMVSCEYGKSMPSKVKIVASLDDEDGEGEKIVYGLYERNTDTVFIIRKLLSGNLDHALGVVDHEFEHRTYGHSDRTRAFENDLTGRIGSLLCRQYGA